MVKAVKAAILFHLAAALPAAALSFSVSGGWPLTIDGTNLSGTAGSDLVSSYLSVSNALVIDVTDAVDEFDVWYIDVHQVEVAWDNSLAMSAIRTTDGTGLGTISGGEALQEITGTATRFFEGTGNRSAIHIQLALEGVSVTLGGDTYSLQIVFTLLDGS